MDSERGLVLEIIPCPRLGLAHVVTMTRTQSRKVSEYSTTQSKLLKEMGSKHLFLDITYVPIRNWNQETFKTIPIGSAIFPVLDAKTVRLEKVRPLLT